MTAGLFVFIAEGTDNADKGYVLTTNDDITVGTTDLAFTQFSKAGDITAGNGMSQAGTAFHVGADTGIAVNGSQVLVAAPLSYIASLTAASGKLAYFDSATSAALTTLTAFGRSLLDDADAAAGRTTLGLGSMATQAHTSVNIDGGTIDGITFDGGSF